MFKRILAQYKRSVRKEKEPRLINQEESESKREKEILQGNSKVCCRFANSIDKNCLFRRGN